MALKSYPDEVDFTHGMSQVTLRLLELTFEEAALENEQTYEVCQTIWQEMNGLVFSIWNENTP